MILTKPFNAPISLDGDLGIGQSNMGPKPRDYPIRFWEKVNKSGPDDCWNWTGSVGVHGYGYLLCGTLKRGRRNVLAHRLSYLIHHGSLPDKMILHSCDNKLCVNPAHLRVGNHQQNMRESVDRLGMNCGEKNGNAKLTAEQVVAIRAMVWGGGTRKRAAEVFGVSTGTVDGIVTRKRWSHV